MLLCLVVLVSAADVRAARTVTVGVLGDGLGVRCFLCPAVIVAEVEALTRGEFEVRFPESKRQLGDWTLAGVRRGLEVLLNDPQVDLILAMGPLAAVEAGRRGPLPKPVIAPIVIDPVLQGLPLTNGASGVRNFSYVASIKSFERDVETFRRIVAFRHLAILVDRGLIEALPQLRLAVARAARRFGFEVSLVPVEDSVYELMASLPVGIDAVYVAPLLRFGEADVRALASALALRKLPSFSLFGGREVELGLLASMAADDDGRRLARRVALNVQRVLLGEDPATFAVAMTQRERFTINLRTARALGLSPPWEVVTEAYTINEEESLGPRLTLRRAIDIALQANLGLAVSRLDPELAADDLALARSRRRPGISLGATALQIDEDRAAASFGQQPERTASASATLTQLIYADGVDAEVEIQGHRLAAAREDLNVVERDTVLAAASAFLQVLRARSLERIRKDNLETTRTNFGHAETRRAIGAAAPGEVVRWEREIADNLKSLAEARATRHRAETRLNQVLHQPLAREVAVADVSFENAGLLATDRRVTARVGNAFDLEVLTGFMVAEGLRNSAELASLDAAVEARRRALLAARRARLPTVSAQATLSERLARSGAGANVPSNADDTDWSVALNLSLPLYEGGGIGVERDKAQRRLMQLHAQRAELAQGIEARVVDAMFALHASWPSVEYTARASAAAARNLELVSDAYSKGAVSILDLLDAQTADLASHEAAATAEYEVLADLFTLQRATGRFDYLMSEAQRREWFARLADAFEEAGR